MMLARRNGAGAHRVNILAHLHAAAEYDELPHRPIWPGFRHGFDFQIVSDFL